MLLSSYYHSKEWLDVDTMPEVFPGSFTIQPEDFSEMCNELNQDDAHYKSRIEVAKCIKDICQTESNRAMIMNTLRVEFAKTLDSMLLDESCEIVRYALFILNLFANSISCFSTM